MLFDKTNGISLTLTVCLNGSGLIRITNIFVKMVTFRLLGSMGDDEEDELNQVMPGSLNLSKEEDKNNVGEIDADSVLVKSHTYTTNRDD